MAILASAANLAGTVSGDDVSLQWTHPDDIVAQNIVFDVFASQNPLDLLQHQVASGVAALSKTVVDLPLTGTVYFTVVSRRGDQISLPAAAIALAIAPPATPAPGVQPGPIESPPPSGLGFPFGVTPLGGVHAEGGDALLRGRILQLLLTAPGERVNLPDFGTRIIDLVFDPGSDVLAATTEFMIARALQKFMGSEIRVDGVSVKSDGAELSIDIVYLKTSDLRMERVRVGVPLP